jgi:hypothetical protein
MDTPTEYYKAVKLGGVLSILAESPRVADRLRTEFGPHESELALEMLRQSKLTGDLGDSVHDFLSDEISNEAEESWSRDAVGGYGPYSVRIMDYEGVLFVRANEFDDVGYFTDFDAAQDYVYSNWEHWDDEEE